MRELPAEYLESCPIIDDKYRVLFRLGFGRFSTYRLPYPGSSWASDSRTTNASPSKS